MTANLNAFTYPAIEHDKQIRLLTIKPGQISDPISCKLSHESLDDPERPRYDTMSHTWGSQEDPLDITCNGQCVWTTGSVCLACILI
jgi:hypothetical protein